MNDAVISVSAPARLHFGLMRFEDPNGLSFGGLGMMVRDPRTIVRVRRSECWTSTGPSANAALASARNTALLCADAGSERFGIEVAEAPPRHRGFGSGTQLALAVATGVYGLKGVELDDAATLAEATGRARRSAIGTHGFLQGGLLWEQGRAPGQTMSPLETRVGVPEAWRVLLLQPRSRAGRHGHDESSVFDDIPPVPSGVTQTLEDLAAGEILPAAEAGEFDRFATNVATYGETAGRCFRSVQGGPFATRQVADLVDAARNAGGGGVGQTSWGPTVFAFAEDQAAAEVIAARLNDAAPSGALSIAMTQPDNTGAVVAMPDTT